jgi:DNA-binding PadR family transcriptional regulator
VSTVPKPTTTSYAILGLLAIRPWTTYELTKQMDRSLGRVWPRAVSKLYEEPKKLVALGFARAGDEAVGKRRRTTYAITPRGRRALRRWLGVPGGGPVLEWEQLLKLQFAEYGTKQDALAELAAARAWALERNEENLAAARAYAAGEGPFPGRAAVNSLAGRFLTDFYALVKDWAEWASEVVDTWPDDPRAAKADQRAMAETVRRAERMGSAEPPA